MTKVKTRGTKTESILLVIFIVAGIFTTLFPFFIIGVEAQPPIKVGDGSSGIAYDPVNKRMYVTNSGDDTVSVIDTTTNKVIDTNPNTPQIDPIMVGGGPAGIAYDPTNERMYVENRNDKSISVIDTTTNKVIDTNPNTPQIDPIMVGGEPEDIVYDPVNKRIYVANFDDNTVSVIDTTTNKVIDTNPNTPAVTDPITVGDAPTGIAYDPVHKMIYVSNHGDDLGNDTVSVIDTTTNKVVGSIRVGDEPLDIAYDDPVNKRMYVTNSGDNTVSVIDTTTNKVVGSVRVGDEPLDIAYDPVNKRMYVTNSGDDTVSVIDTTTNKVVGSFTFGVGVGVGPFDIAYDPVNKKMYVTNIGDNTVSVIDTTTNTIVGNPITVGNGPQWYSV